MKLLVILPAFNEEKAIAPLLDELTGILPSLPDIDVQPLVVDDGSSDHTADVARAHGARVVRLCRNLGIGGAVQTGIRIAVRESFDAALQMDGDGQHPPAELHKLVAALRSMPPPDLVVGNRYIGREGFNSTALRRFGAWWLKCLVRALTGVTVTDPTSGYRAYGPRALRLFDRDYPYDYPEPEALVIALAAGLSIAETPVLMRERQGGVSSIFGWRAPYYMLKVTLAVLLAYIRNIRRPVKEAHGG